MKLPSFFFDLTGCFSTAAGLNPEPTYGIYLDTIQPLL
jgi:hypothetical protein